MKQTLAYLLIACCAFITSANAAVTSNSASLKIAKDEITLTSKHAVNCNFLRGNDGTWRINSFDVWDRASAKWDRTYSSVHGEFVYMGEKPDFRTESTSACLYAREYEKIDQNGLLGIRFSGDTDLSGAKFVWTASYFFDTKDSIPLLHCEVTYKADRDLDLGYSPKIVTRTIASSASEHGSMAHIISYEQSEKPVLIERGFPLIWLNAVVGDKGHNALLIDDVDQESPEGRYFVFSRSPEAPYTAYWLIGALRKDSSPYGQYYWNYRNPATGLYPEETKLYANREYKIRCASVYGLNYTNLQFYRMYWGQAFDHVSPLDTMPFWAKNWDECAHGEIEEFKDNDKNAGDRYVDGKGYFSAPKKDKMSHGNGNVCWHGTAGIAHAMMYYSWATGDKKDFDFYKNRLTNANLPKWAASTSGNKGWINEFWQADSGYEHWSSMWGSLDFGAYNLYNCYKLTGDKTYWNLYKRMIDYVADVLIKDRGTLGEHWTDQDEHWYYLTPESSFTKAKRIEKGQDPGDYPGSLSVYAYLCLLTYNETKEVKYKDHAFAYIDHINTFLTKPQQFWTLCRVPKSNGLAFACLANIKRYELTKNERYLDYAQEWMYLLFTMYHLRNEGGQDMGFAHASALGVFDYVCVSSLETIEPIYLVTNLLKYRVDPVLLRYLAMADRRHLAAYPKTHPDKKFDYEYIPMELVPQMDSFAMYMAGPVMIENVMLHAIHSSSDPEITVVCLDAAETGLGLKDQRNMIAYNPTTKEREFTLKIKGLNAGRYTVEMGAGVTKSITSVDLEKDGMKMSLGAQKWVRIVVKHAAD
jgi:hypothetical protein